MDGWFAGLDSVWGCFGERNPGVAPWMNWVRYVDGCFVLLGIYDELWG